MATKLSINEKPILTSLAISYQPTVFSAVLFPGKLEDGLKAAAANRFNAVEISLRDPDSVDLDWIARKLDEYHLQFSAIATGQSYLHDQLSFFTSSPGVAKSAVKRVQRFIEFAERFGANVIIGGIRGKLSGNVEEHQDQRSVGIKSIQQCANFALDHGVTLLLEPINRYETNLVNSAADGLEMLAEINFPNVKLLMDTFHMNIEERDIQASIERVGEHLGYVHFADSNRWAPGQGHIRFHEILTSLRKINYQGYISAEILPLPDHQTAAKFAGDYLAQLLTA